MFFGPQGDTSWVLERLRREIPGYRHDAIDIRNREAVLALVKELRPALIIHTAAQPSHDRAAAIPFLDFEVNANGTLNMLEAARQFCPESPFIHMSRNKVYGDRPNTIVLKELETRWEYADPAYENGIPESFSIDQSKHSLFGASKVAGDVMVQEYGRYFNIPTCCLRGGCLTGPNHAGVELHGFLSYLVKCNLEEREYKVFGYKGKQVRDNIHAEDVARLKTECNAFRLDTTAPLPAGVSERGMGVNFSTHPPISLYGSTKLASETVALEYGEAFGFPVWVTRCGVLAGAGQFGTPDQGIFSYWINAHLRRRPLRYIGFGSAGRQVRDALHPQDLAALLDAQMRSTRQGGQRIYTLGGGPGNAVSLAMLNAWCDARFGPHAPEADLRCRPYDIPWIVMDSSDAGRDFGWQPEVRLDELLERIACHAERNPDWLERSGL